MLPRSSMLNHHQAIAKAYFKRLGRRQDRHAADLALAQELRQPNALRLYAPIAASPVPSPSAPTFEGATAFCASLGPVFQHMPVVKIRRHRHVDLSLGEF